MTGFYTRAVTLGRHFHRGRIFTSRSTRDFYLVGTKHCSSNTPPGIGNTGSQDGRRTLAWSQKAARVLRPSGVSILAGGHFIPYSHFDEQVFASIFSRNSSSDIPRRRGMDSFGRCGPSNPLPLRGETPHRNGCSAGGHCH